MRVAILAQFPLHLLPEFAHFGEPTQHYATWLPQLAESFASTKGLEFHWVTLTTQVDRPRTCQWQGQTFHLLPTAPSKRASTFFYRDRLAIRQCLQEIRPDLVHGWGTEDVYALAAVWSGFPHLVSMAGLLSYYVLKTKMHPRDYFQALVELFILRSAQVITVETKWGRKVLQRRTKRPIYLVEYGVRPVFFEKKWCPDPQKPTALFVGSIHPRKGIQDLIACFQDPRLQSYELRVAGAVHGQWAEELKASSSKNVVWLGQITAHQIAQELTQAWCLALPTRCDTSPNVVKEARVIGLPVITTPEGGQSDYIESGLNGYLLKASDIPAWRNTFTQIFSEFEYCRQLGTHHHEKARADFNPQKTCDQFLKIYHHIISAGPFS